MFLLHLTYFVGIAFLLVEECCSLKSLIIRVPEAVKSGDTVTLSCEYDLEQVALYSIKWYWNEREFYRFVPKESPPYIAFKMKFINVDTSRSGRTTVTLLGVRKELTGEYKCEVSADAPFFHTDIKSARMTVAELPTGNPVMNIEPSKVEIGKKIKAECYSPGSDPAANLTWYINDEKVTESTGNVIIFEPEIQTDQAIGLHSVKSELVIKTHRFHFVKGSLRVSCEASIYSLWNSRIEGIVRDESPQLAHVLGSTSHSQTGMAFNSSFSTRTSPLIIVVIQYSIFAVFLFR